MYEREGGYCSQIGRAFADGPAHAYASVLEPLNMHTQVFRNLYFHEILFQGIQYKGRGTFPLKYLYGTTR